MKSVGGQYFVILETKNSMNWKKYSIDAWPNLFLQISFLWKSWQSCTVTWIMTKYVRHEINDKYFLGRKFYSIIISIKFGFFSSQMQRVMSNKATIHNTLHQEGGLWKPISNVGHNKGLSYNGMAYQLQTSILKLSGWNIWNFEFKMVRAKR